MIFIKLYNDALLSFTSVEEFHFWYRTIQKDSEQRSDECDPFFTIITENEYHKFRKSISA